MYVAFEIECKVVRDYILLIRLDINQKYLRSVAVRQLRHSHLQDLIVSRVINHVDCYEFKYSHCIG